MATWLVKLIAVDAEPLHTVWLVGVTVITGVGYSVILKLVGVPTQPLAVGVMTTVPTIFTKPLLAAVVNESGLSAV